MNKVVLTFILLVAIAVSAIECDNLLDGVCEETEVKDNYRA